jgi:hypothetical protein
LVGLAGDYNGDGKVDAADYVVWRKFDGTPAGYDRWRANFGATAGSGAAIDSAGNSSVPEPTASWLLAVCILLSAAIRAKSHGRVHIGHEFA